MIVLPGRLVEWAGGKSRRHAVSTAARAVDRRRAFVCAVGSRLPRITLVAAIVAALVLGAGARPMARQQGGTVLIFAAASLQTALDELTPAIDRSTGAHAVVSYAASSALARQIDDGAPADLFISADLDWMDYVAARHRIQPATRVDLLGNDLVLVAPAARPVSLRIAPGFPIAEALGANRLAIADPDSVPAGKYGRAALTALGVWDRVSGKLAPAENVRAALLLVSRGEAPLGIVYRTDALADAGVRIVDVFPDWTHPAVVYPAALTTGAAPNAARVLTFLESDQAKTRFVKLGFKVDVK
jgi:molybdate transport system substrate-binding protein